MIQQFIAENSITVLKQPPYSPNLDPCDFFLFPQLKGVIKKARFQNSMAITTAVTKELRAISVKSFQKYLQTWQRSKLREDTEETEKKQLNSLSITKI